MNEFSISHSGPTLYILVDIENNILCAQNITLVSKNNIKIV
jgi:phosphopantetheinyl transferase